MSDQAMQSAIALIKEEHGSLAAVIKAMQQQVDLAESGQGRPDFRLLRRALYYIETFTEGIHHPKEEVYLFRATIQQKSGNRA